jgi:hypothetical protein
MNLRVGPFVYRVELVPGYIPFEGDDCLGLCDNEHHLILVSDRCSDAQRVQVLCHEYMEAWLYHFGQNLRDKEAWCDLFGLAMAGFVLDLMRTLRTEDAWALFTGDGEAESGAERAVDDADEAGVPEPPPTAPPPGRQPKRAGRAVTAVRVTDRLVAGPAEGDPAWRVRIFEALREGL